jgi:uncharacterized protein (TIGR01244 family)
MNPPIKVTEEFFVAAQPDRNDISDLAGQGFRTMINNRPDGEAADQPSHEEMRAEAERLGLEYRYIPVKTETITVADVEAQAKAVRDCPQPVVAHCRSGTRSYLLLAADRVLKGGEDPERLVTNGAERGIDLRNPAGFGRTFAGEPLGTVQSKI